MCCAPTVIESCTQDWSNGKTLGSEPRKSTFESWVLNLDRGACSQGRWSFGQCLGVSLRTDDQTLWGRLPFVGIGPLQITQVWCQQQHCRLQSGQVLVQLQPLVPSRSGTRFERYAAEVRADHTCSISWGSSVVERGPEEPGVGGAIPPPSTCKFRRAA